MTCEEVIDQMDELMQQYADEVIDKMLMHKR